MNYALSKLDETGGYAALGQGGHGLADLGTLSVSANTYTTGFGTMEQRVNERATGKFMQFDAATNLELGKLLPKKLGLIHTIVCKYQPNYPYT